MLRFSIRDVLWLTVVVGLGCIIALNSPMVLSLRAQVLRLEKEAKEQAADMQTVSLESAAYRIELEKALGESVYGVDLKPDQNQPGSVRYRVYYGVLVPGRPSEPKGSGTFLTRFCE
jgi:hypothetical protein